MTKHVTITTSFFSFFLFLLAAASFVHSSEFRTIRPFGQKTVLSTLPQKGIALSSSFSRLEHLLKEHAATFARLQMVKICNSWHSEDFAQYLGSNYYDRNRLLDTLRSFIPEEARLRLLAVESVRPLSTELVSIEEGRVAKFVTTVSLRARTQIEYSDPIQGPKREEGLNDYILSVTVKLALDGAITR